MQKTLTYRVIGGYIGAMNRRAEIINVAQIMARKGGYDAFSFREIAKAIGIKAASVHYYFPAKEDLAVELIADFSARLQEKLGDANAIGVRPVELLDRFIDAYSAMIAEEKQVCLGLVFGAQRAHLPAPVAAAVTQFFAHNTAWLARVFTHAGAAKPRTLALTMLATLEGAMVLATTLEDTAAFGSIVQSMKVLVLPRQT